MHKTALALALLAGLASPQGSLRRHPLPKPAASFGATKHFWVATLSNKEILGGSLYANRSALLKTTSDAKLLLAGTSIPRVVVVEEPSGAGKARYHGLAADGTWVAIEIDKKSDPISARFSETLALIDTGGAAALLFNPWAAAWQLIPRAGGGKPAAVTLEDTVAVAWDGARLTGYSAFTAAPASLATSHSNVRYVDDDLGGGTRRGSGSRAALAFETGPKQISFYSSYTNTWTGVAVSDASKVRGAGPLVIEYQRNHVLVQDGNKGIFYSALTGNAVTQSFSDLSKILDRTDKLDIYRTEDSAAWFVDPGTDTGYVYRPVDDTVLQIPVPPGTQAASGGPVPPPRSGGIEDDDWAGFILGDLASRSVKMSIASGVAGKASWATADLSGESVVIFANIAVAGSNDTLFGIMTDKAIYGYSSVTNSFDRAPYAGLPSLANPPQVEDFIAYAVIQRAADDELLVFSSRTGKWVRRSISKNAVIKDDDGVITVREGNKLRVFGNESLAFTGVDVVASPTQAGEEDSHAYVVQDAAGGGSEIEFFSRIADAWTVAKTSTRLTAADLAKNDDWLIARTPAEILTFSAFPDVNSQLSWILDNRPYHAVVKGVPARFVAAGPPGGTHFLVIGVARRDSTIPFIGGRLRVDVSAPFAVVRAGTFDARGVRRFDLAMPSGPGTVFLQNLTIDRTLTTAAFGQLYPFQVH